MKLTLFHKGLILVSIPLCFEISIFGVLINLQNQAESEAQRVSKNKAINDDVNAILRKALLLGKAKTLNFMTMAFNDHMNEIFVNFADLEQLTRDDPALYANVVACKQAMGEARREARYIQALVHSGKDQHDPVVMEHRTKVFRLMQEAIGSGFLELADRTSQGSDDTRSRELREKIKELLQWALGLSVLMGVFGATMFSKHLVNRLNRLGVNATKLAKGETLSPPEKGTDEVAELDRSFHAAADAIAEATRMRQEATAMITHDLKTPLQSIRSFLEMLRHGMLAELNDQGMELLTHSEKETVRMVGLIDSVLQLEKMRSGNVKLRFTTAKPAALLNKAIEAVTPVAAEKNVEIKCEYIGLRNETIQADGQLIEQVLVNFLINAIKFSPAQSAVIVILQSTANEITVTFTDRGPGMSLEEQKLVFERFHRITTSDVSIPNTGLGLAISKELVELHHGSIEIESKVGAGSTFRIHLPKKQTGTPGAISVGGSATAVSKGSATGSATGSSTDSATGPNAHASATTNSSDGVDRA